MKRLLAIMLVVVLVVGTQVLPILHMAHCHANDGHEGHTSSHCPICQLVNAPIHDAEPQVESVAAPVAYASISAPPRLVYTAVLGGSAQSRAPPVA